MITEEDIGLIIASGEGYNAEFKVSVPSKVRELSEEVCAFANAAGGVVLIGVDDQNEIKGVTIDNVKRSAIQNSIGDITPSLYCSISLIEVKGKRIGVIEVPSGPNKPYVLSGAIYVRIGPNSQKLTTAEQMRDFFLQSGKIFFDEADCKEFVIDNQIDNEVLTIFKRAAHLTENTPDTQIFKNLKLLTDDNQFKNGAVLFFGKQPELIFEKAVLRCVAFKGIDKQYIIDDKFFGGPLYNQYNKAIQWLKEKTNLRYDIEGQGSGPRKEIWEIPEIVFKEAIINILSHRDYFDKGATIIVELFDDRIEISNPGGLVSAISRAEFGKRSHSRNPLIFGLFARMQLVEQVGSGINRMNNLMLEAGLSAPEYNTEGMFSIILKRPKYNDDSETKDTVGDELSDKHRYKLGDSTRNELKTVVKTVVKSSEKTVEKSSEKIISLMMQNNFITIFELSQKIGITTRAIEKQIHKLKGMKIIEHIGPDKGGHWKLLDKTIHPKSSEKSSEKNIEQRMKLEQ